MRVSVRETGDDIAVHIHDDSGFEETITIGSDEKLTLKIRSELESTPTLPPNGPEMVVNGRSVVGSYTVKGVRPDVGDVS